MKYIIATLLAVFFIAGCVSGGQRSPLGEYRVGTQGLELMFTSRTPPSVVYAEDETFPIIVEIRNRGVYPGEDDSSLHAHLFFTGFDSRILQGLDSQLIEFQPGEAKTRYNPEGGMYIATGEAHMDRGMFAQSRIDSYTAQIRATLCYPYKTYASVDVCIDPNPNRDSRFDACRPGVTGAGSQGAPVAVTSVETVPQRGQARFIITVTNVGGGELLNIGNFSDCTVPDLSRSLYDRIHLVNAELSSGLPLSCSPSGDISMINNRATIVCKADGLNENDPAYKSLLHLEFEYGYKKTIQRSTTIRGD